MLPSHRVRRTTACRRCTAPGPAASYRNRGDGTFAVATAAAGMAREFGPALGRGDRRRERGWLDRHLRRQRSAGEPALGEPAATARFAIWRRCGAWRSARRGRPRRIWGWTSATSTTTATRTCSSRSSPSQGSTLYVNDGSGLFAERSAAAGIRHPSLPFTGFGAGWLDFDNDGWLDLLAGQRPGRRDASTVPTPARCFRSINGISSSGTAETARFEDVSARAGTVLRGCPR